MTDGTTGGEASTAELNWQSLFALLGRAHTKELLYELAIRSDPPVRFSALQDALDLSANTLSRRLDELEAAGFLVRQSYDEIPPRVEYEPTPRLYDLEPAFSELEAWLQEYGADDLYGESEE